MKDEFVEVNFNQLWHSMCDIGTFIIGSPSLRSDFPNIRVRVHADGIDLLRISPRVPEADRIRRASNAGAGSVELDGVVL